MENAGGKPKYLQFQNFLPRRIFLRFPAMVVAKGRRLRFDPYRAGGGQHTTAGPRRGSSIYG
jgi:hypothetical protein